MIEIERETDRQAETETRSIILINRRETLIRHLTCLWGSCVCACVRACMHACVCACVSCACACSVVVLLGGGGCSG